VLRKKTIQIVREGLLVALTERSGSTAHFDATRTHRIEEVPHVEAGTKSSRLTISSSATSNPRGTCSVLILGEVGVLNGWFATSVSCTPVRSAAR
jgi:hypothetical protein